MFCLPQRKINKGLAEASRPSSVQSHEGEDVAEESLIQVHKKNNGCAPGQAKKFDRQLVRYAIKLGCGN